MKLSLGFIFNISLFIFIRNDLFFVLYAILTDYSRNSKKFYNLLWIANTLEVGNI